MKPELKAVGQQRLHSLLLTINEHLQMFLIELTWVFLFFRGRHDVVSCSIQPLWSADYLEIAKVIGSLDQILYSGRRCQPPSRNCHALMILQRIRWLNRGHFKGSTGTGVADFDRALCQAEWNVRNAYTNG